MFSTSKDHGQGKRAMAGCILVDVDKIQVINRSVSYKNKYIHHRSSVGTYFDGLLSDGQVKDMMTLGLCRPDSDTYVPGSRAQRKTKSGGHESGAVNMSVTFS